MKNTTTLGQIVVTAVEGAVVVKFAEVETRKAEILEMVRNGVTVRIQPQLPVNKKANIAEAEVVASELMKLAVTENVDSQSTKQSKGEVKTMTKQTQVKPMVAEHKNQDRAERNPNVGRFQSHAETVANQRFFDAGEFPVTVQSIEWFARPDGYKRIGKMTVQFPENYAEVRYYENDVKQWFWYDFCEFNMNQFRSSFNPEGGSGILTLAIKQNANGELYVSLPRSRNEEDPTRPYDKFRTRDVRFPDSNPHTDNNRNLEAALTAYLRFFEGEFVQANPKNRNGINEDCTTCKYNMYIPGFDGMDNEESGFKNTLDLSDTIEMAQWGQDIPRRFCMVNRELVDLEIVKEINELTAMDQSTYYDEEGTLRYTRPNEIVIAGKAVNKYIAIRQGTADRCGNCPFYHNNSAKTDAQINKEKDAGAEYVSKYWSEMARAERQAIQTLVPDTHGHKWVTGFPGEFDQAKEFRVYGLGGVVIYGSEEVNEAVVEFGVLNQVALMENETVEDNHAAKIINIIHSTCNTFARVTPEQLNEVLALVAAKPEGMSARMDKRWDGALKRLVETIESNK